MMPLLHSDCQRYSLHHSEDLKVIVKTKQNWGSCGICKGPKKQSLIMLVLSENKHS